MTKHACPIMALALACDGEPVDPYEESVRGLGPCNFVNEDQLRDMPEGAGNDYYIHAARGSR